MIKFLKKNAFLIVFILSVAVRLVSLNQSLWLDESGTVVAAKNSSFLTLVTTYSEGDFHPPGYFVILWAWIKMSGTSEVWVRVPSVIFGVLTVCLTYLIGRKLFSKNVGLIGGFLIALSPLHIYYSQEARMYSFAAFAATLSIYSLIKLIREERYGFLLYGISVFLILYSDYVTYFILPAECLYIFWFEKAKIKKWMGALLLGGATIVPWLFVFPTQLGIGRGTASTLEGWRDVVGGVSVKSISVFVAKLVVGRISLENKKIYALLVAGFLTAFGYLTSQLIKKLKKEHYLLLIWFFIPTILGVLVSLVIPIFAYFRYIYILPAFYLILAATFERINLVNLLKVVQVWALVGILVIECWATSQYLFIPTNQREDWRDAISYVDEIDTPSTLILFKDVKVLSTYVYYTQKGGNAYPGLVTVPVVEPTNLENFHWDKKSRVIVFDYLTEITDPQKLLDKKIQQEGFKPRRIANFNGVGFIRIFER